MSLFTSTNIFTHAKSLLTCIGFFHNDRTDILHHHYSITSNILHLVGLNYFPTDLIKQFVSSMEIRVNKIHDKYIFNNVTFANGIRFRIRRFDERPRTICTVSLVPSTYSTTDDV